MSSGRYDIKEAEIAYNSADDTDALVDTKSSNKTLTWTIIGVLVGVLAVVIMALIGVSIAFGISSNSSSSSSNDDDVCLTEGCVQASAQISLAMNKSVDPCDDFYQFACGNWLKTTAVPSGFDTYNFFQNTPFDANKVALGKIFASDIDGGVAGVRKALDFYKSCMDINTIEQRGVEPLRELIRMTGGWSLVGIAETEPWTINSTSFQNELLYGSDAFFSYGIEVDTFNSSRINLVLTQAGFDTTPGTYNNIPEYARLIVRVLSLINPVSDNTTYVNAANAIINFEISTIVQSLVAPGNFTQQYNPFTINELQSDVFPQFDWRGFLEAYYRLANPSYVVTGNDRIILKTPNYFRNLSRMFSNLTDPSVIQNYAKWRLIKTFGAYLNEEFKQPFVDFTQVISPGAPATSDRSLLCSIYVQNGMPIALSRLYTDNALPSGTKETLSMTTEMIRDAFKQRLQANQWLDDFSRQRCVEKAEAIVKMVAYPDDLFNNSYVNGFYDRLTIDVADFFGNYIGTLEQNQRNRVRQFFNGVSRSEWPINLLDLAKPTDVNAFYTPNLNEIIILEGILSPPPFNAKWPDYMNFGGIGSVIGHEISHGFDNTGQQFDKDGILQQWWSDEGVSRFNNRLPCFVNQYNGYTIEGYQVDGQRTLGENIADLGGLNAAFLAHRNRLSTGGVTQRLPSLDYNVDQLFFIAFAQLWCTVYTPSGAQRLLTTDTHSPGQARVLGPLLNSPDFAGVFNCPVGSRMNPTTNNKCELW